MKKDNMGKLLGVALVVAIICTGLFYMLFAMKANSQSGTTMVVAAKALKAGMVLTPADLKTITWPVPQLPPGRIATRRRSSATRFSTPWRRMSRY